MVLCLNLVTQMKVGLTLLKSRSRIFISLEEEIQILKSLPDELKKAKAAKQKELDELKSQLEAANVTHTQQRELDRSVWEKEREIIGIERSESRAADRLKYKEQDLERSRGYLERDEKSVAEAEQRLKKLEDDHEARIQQLRTQRIAKERDPREVS